MFLFEIPIKKTKVRNGVYAHKFHNGVILIGETRYFFYSMTEAIKKWREDNPIR